MLVLQDYDRKRTIKKTFIRFIGPNSEFRKSILISDTLLDCSIEELYKTISKTYKEYKKNNERTIE